MENDNSHDEDMRLANNESLDSTTVSSAVLELDIGPRISQENLILLVNSLREMCGEGILCTNNGTTNMLTVPLTKENFDVAGPITHRMKVLVKDKIDRVLCGLGITSSTVGFHSQYHKPVNGPRVPGRRVPSYVP